MYLEIYQDQKSFKIMQFNLWFLKCNQININNFYDLSLIKNKLNFTDSIHITDKSNFLVASEIYNHLKNQVLLCNK